MGRNKELAKNTSFVVIGSIGSKLMGFIMLPLYTRWLSPTDYGITDIITTYALLMLNVVACDVSDAIFVFPIGATREKIKAYYSSGLFFEIFCSMICAIIFFALSFIPSDNTFFVNIWFVYGILITSLFQKYTQDFCRGIKKMSVFTYTGIIQSLTIAGTSILLIPSLGVYGFVLAMMIANVITTLFTLVYSKSYQYLSISSWDTSSLKEMLVFSLPLIPTAILWWLILALNRPLLEQYVGVFAIGLLAVANKLPSLLNIVFGFFQQAWIVTVIEEFEKSDFADYYNKMFRIIFAVQEFLCLIIAICAKLFITLMTTEEYYDAWIYIPLLSLSVVFSNISTFCGTVFSAARKTKYTFYSVIVGGVVAVLSNFILIPLWGLWGACLAICIAHLSSAVSRILFSSKLVAFKNTQYVVLQIAIMLAIFLSMLMENLYIVIPIILVSISMFVYTNKSSLFALKGILDNRIKKC